MILPAGSGHRRAAARSEARRRAEEAGGRRSPGRLARRSRPILQTRYLQFHPRISYGWAADLTGAPDRVEISLALQDLVLAIAVEDLLPPPLVRGARSRRRGAPRRARRRGAVRGGRDRGGRSRRSRRHAACGDRAARRCRPRDRDRRRIVGGVQPARADPGGPRGHPGRLDRVHGHDRAEPRRQGSGRRQAGAGVTPGWRSLRLRARRRRATRGSPPPQGRLRRRRPGRPERRPAGRPRSAGRARARRARARRPRHLQRRRGEPAVVARAAGLDAGAGEVERTVERGERRRLEHEPRARCPRHLEPVAEQPEARDVGRAADPVPDEDLGRRPVERAHLVDRGIEVGVGRPALASAAHEEARAEALRQQQDVAGPRAALAEQPVGMRGADDREPVLRLGVADRVAAGEDAARLADLRGRSLEHRRERRLREVLGERGDRQREQHPPAHREHVGQRVGGGDLAIRDRVVDERRKEVERAEDRQVVRDAVRGGVVGRLEAGDERRVVGPCPRRARTSASASRSAPSFAAQPPHSVSSVRRIGGSSSRRRCGRHRPIIGRPWNGLRSPFRGSGGVPVGSPVFNTGGAAPGVARWVRLPCAPATFRRSRRLIRPCARRRQRGRGHARGSAWCRVGSTLACGLRVACAAVSAAAEADDRTVDAPRDRRPSRAR